MKSLEKKRLGFDMRSKTESLKHCIGMLVAAPLKRPAFAISPGKLLD